jgi:hypothetical protein
VEVLAQQIELVSVEGNRHGFEAVAENDGRHTARFADARGAFAELGSPSCGENCGGGAHWWNLMRWSIERT